MKTILTATIIFYYCRKGDAYEDIVSAAATCNVYGNNGNGNDRLKGGGLGIQSGVPPSWKDVKLIRSEDLKLRGFTAKQQRTTRKRRQQKIPFYLHMLGTKFYLYVKGYFLEVSGIKRHDRRPLRGIWQIFLRSAKKCLSERNVCQQPFCLRLRSSLEE